MTGKPKNMKLAMLLLAALFVFGCSSATVPPTGGQTAVAANANSSAGSAGNNPAQAPKATSSQRWEYAMEKAQQGALLGMVLAGPFGAYGGAGGQFLGFLYGLATADSHAAEQHAKAQVQSPRLR